MINNFYLILIPIIIIFINCFYYKNLKLEKFTDNKSEGTNKKLIRELINKSYNSSVFENIEYIVEKLEKIKNDESVDNLGIAGDFNLIPFQKGIVVAFNGDKIPEGWAECNGDKVKNSYGEEFQTPDLRGKFILGTKENSGSIGGKKVVKLEIDNLPKHRHIYEPTEKHTHNYQDNYLFHKDTGKQSYGDANKSRYLSTKIFKNEKEHKYKYIYSGRKHNIESDDKRTECHECLHNHFSPKEGGNESHNNMPPYYVLKYIIKIE